MEPHAPVDPQALVEQMRQETEQMLRQVMAAVSAARDGAWINDSEMTVRDLLAEFRQKVYQTALQLRADAAEGAFSPSRPAHRPAAEESGGL